MEKFILAPQNTLSEYNYSPTQVSAVATGESGRAVPLPPNDCLRPLFWFTQIIVFGTSRSCKTTTMILKE